MIGRGRPERTLLSRSDGRWEAFSGLRAEKLPN